MAKKMMGAGGFLVLSLALATPAGAATVQRDYLSHGIANCRASSFADESSLYRSAMGMKNVGSKSIFVTCDFDVSPNVPNLTPNLGIDQVAIAFLNYTATDASIGCTLASGILHVAIYSPKTAFASRNLGAAGVAFWSATNDFGGNKIAAPAVTCVLPPNIEISYTVLKATEEVGQ